MLANTETALTASAKYAEDDDLGHSQPGLRGLLGLQSRFQTVLQRQKGAAIGNSDDRDRQAVHRVRGGASSGEPTRQALLLPDMPYQGVPP